MINVNYINFVFYKVIRKTRLHLQHIEKCTPINAQPALFHALIHYEQFVLYSSFRSFVKFNNLITKSFRDLIGGDPRIDPVNLFHRWMIRSKYKDINFGYEFDQSEKSTKILESLYKSLSQEFMVKFI